MSSLAEFLRELFQNPDGVRDAVLASDAFFSFKRLLAFLSMIFVIGIVMILPKLADAEQRRKASHGAPKRKKEEPVLPERWEVVLAHRESGHPAEWRLAILEADNILADLVRAAGYRGESLGEMLKGIDAGDLPSIQSAWEAHRTRNAIAHEGANFQISERETRRIVGLYEKVFRDLGYF